MTQRSKRYILAAVAIIAVIVVVVTYYFFDPTHSTLAPKCPFKLATGLDCPACGNQRALHSALNGNIVDAFMFNPFLWLALPYILLIIYATLCDSRHAQRLQYDLLHRYTIYIYVALFVGWWIVRNTPL